MLFIVDVAFYSIPFLNISAGSLIDGKGGVTGTVWHILLIYIIVVVLKEIADILFLVVLRHFGHGGSAFLNLLLFGKYVNAPVSAVYVYLNRSKIGAIKSVRA